MDNFVLMVFVFFIVMFNFFLIVGGVLFCVYVFILIMISKEGEGFKVVVRESLVIFLGILFILFFYFVEF